MLQCNTVTRITTEGGVHLSKQNRGERIRSERSDKKIRVNSSLTKSVHDKLDRLAMACGVTKTGLAAHLLELCLDNENIINFIQDHHKFTARFRIIPTKIEGELQFIFAEKTKSHR
mgnify:CR=1 FL=1